MSKPTPMYKQYKELKAAHPNALLLYRLGDFYELFEADAEIAARELGLTLTQRRFAKDIKLPMAGFPHRYINSYIARFINKGYMVAVADQLEDSRHARGLVKRGVVRVVTSGTVIDESLLRENKDNFLLALAPDKNEMGLAFIDVSTGDFNCAQLSQTDLLEELNNIKPSEVILPPVLMNDASFCHSLAALGVARLSPLPAEDFSPQATHNRLKARFGVASLEAFGNAPLGLIAAGAVLHYLENNHLSSLKHITHLKTYALQDYLGLDVITRHNLELTRTLRDGKSDGSLLATLNRTQTKMGSRLLRRWINQPLAKRAEIEARLNAVERLAGNAFLRQDIRAALRGIYDLERLAGRIGYGNANARDLINLKLSLSRVPKIKALLKSNAGLLAELNQQLNPLIELVTLIDTALEEEAPILIKEGGLIKTGFNPKLDSLRETAQKSRAWLTDYEGRERQRTGIKNLKIKYNQVFGFFIEVTKSNLKLIPDNYERRATISTGERFITPELKKHERAIINAEDKANLLEYDLFVQVRATVAEQLVPLRQTAQALAQLDVLAGLAEVAALNNYVKPVICDEPILNLRNARHPVVEQVLAGETPFVPNHCRLDDEQKLIVLTGPNMSGKSVYLRQIALAVLMAQMGSFVAAEQAQIGLTDRIFVRAGASDDISQGRSTFLVEMSETAHIIHHATERSLIMLDEVGRGTSTYDGLSLAWAVAEDIHHTLRARCLFATHFHELTELGNALPGAANYNMAVYEQNGQVIFLRQLVAGGADRSYGIHVARLAGLPPRILKTAQEMLATLQQKSAYRQNRPGASLAEKQASYTVETQAIDPQLLLAQNDPLVWEVVGELYRLDIGNLTPVSALLQLNKWQQLLKKGRP